ncbi:hypothetical protein NPIL_112831 [Nephila pilipes]|uniref:PiggyBac transposable element-derived protein domain-containing protein n=1 Tax=Nephila pilipes TaxID=299642 RepID=A0A8X6Q4R9_NEPPI|nr:hypothetical protein NPIL_112831 [Nephila pilipes]
MIPDQDNLLLSDHVVLRLMEPLLGKGKNVTTNKFFTSLTLAEKLMANYANIVGSMKQSRWGIPDATKYSKHPLYSTWCHKHNDFTLIVHHCKKDNNILVLRTMY